MAKSKQKIIARLLRRNGESIKEIAKKLNVSVGSVSTWVNDIQLSDIQISNLAKRKTDPYYGKRRDYLNKVRLKLESKIRRLNKLGAAEIGKLNNREVLLVGIALYWGEGFKKDKLVGLATTNKYIAKFFIYWLYACFNIRRDQLILRVTANISYKKQINTLQEYWSHVLHIDLNYFSKPYYQKTIWKKIYENKEEYHGVLRIKVRKSIDLLRKINGYIEGIALNITNENTGLPTVSRQVQG